MMVFLMMSATKPANITTTQVIVVMSLGRFGAANLTRLPDHLASPNRGCH